MATKQELSRAYRQMKATNKKTKRRALRVIKEMKLAKKARIEY